MMKKVQGTKLMPTNPEVTFVIPSYNSEKSIGLCLQSIKDIGDFPIIVVDDGSTDSTYDIAKGLGVSVIRIVNSGAYLARWEGLLQVKTKYVYFLDSDDLLLPDFLKAVDALEIISEANCLLGSFLSIGNGVKRRQQQQDGWVSAKSLINCHYGLAPISASLWRTEAALGAYQSQPNSLGLRKGDDYELFIRAALDRDLLCKDILMVSYSVPGGKSTSNVRESLKSTINIASYYAESQRIDYNPVPKLIFESIIGFRQSQIAYYEQGIKFISNNLLRLPILIFQIAVAKCFFESRRRRFQ